MKKRRTHAGSILLLAAAAGLGIGMGAASASPDELVTVCEWCEYEYRDCLASPHPPEQCRARLDRCFEEAGCLL